MAVHTEADLRQMQSLPLSAKISMTKRRIRDWYEYWDGMVYVSFSGGKDSTVLKHIIDSMYDDVPALFVNTGLEYPEIQQFAKAQKNVVVRRPKMRFDAVIKTYGYPVINKRVASYIASARNDPNCMRAKWIRGEEFTKFVAGGTYTYLIDAPFNISARCCDIMKKAPAKAFEKETGRKAMTGEMACESLARKQVWMETGCNGFDLKKPVSKPMAFWTEQDILHYIKMYNVPYCSVYGEIRVKQNPDECDGQINAIDFLECWDETDTLETTGCERTGCIFCAFGCSKDKTPRFVRLRDTHPKQYAYCIGGGETVDGIWQPSPDGLGMGPVLDFVGVEY